MSDGGHAPRQSGAARRRAKRDRGAAASAADRGGRPPRSSGPGQGARSSGPDRAARSDRAPRRTADPRRLAADALVRIEEGGAYANLVLGPMLERSDLDERDRHLATELVYGVTRLRRLCDWHIDRFLTGNRPLDPPTRAALRIGTYQLVVLDTAAHAAVSTAVDVAPRRSSGLVNAVLRKIATARDAGDAGPEDPAVRTSVPDWILERLTADLGTERAVAALETMARPVAPTVRADGYTQDQASQWVAALVEAEPGERVLDLCAAPGGKATALAATGATTVAADLRLGRVRLIVANAARTAVRLPALVADGTRPPFRPQSADRVLVDAPCSGLGVLHRRPDARWRIEADAVPRLAELQVRLVLAAAELVRPGGLLVVSACTLTEAETIGVDAAVAAARPDLVALAPPGEPWIPWGRGALLLPQAAGTDGMALHRYRVPT